MTRELGGLALREDRIREALKALTVPASVEDVTQLLAEDRHGVWQDEVAAENGLENASSATRLTLCVLLLEDLVTKCVLVLGGGGQYTPAGSTAGAAGTTTGTADRSTSSTDGQEQGREQMETALLEEFRRDFEKGCGMVDELAVLCGEGLDSDDEADLLDDFLEDEDDATAASSGDEVAIGDAGAVIGDGAAQGAGIAGVDQLIFLLTGGSFATAVRLLLGERSMEALEGQLAGLRRSLDVVEQ